MKPRKKNNMIFSDYKFISHMVQMKLEEKIKKIYGSGKFISHMVQMKPKGQILQGLSALPYLYPTWFRWNAKIKPTVQEFVDIYIPHGSDETSTSLAVPSS